MFVVNDGAFSLGDIALQYNFLHSITGVVHFESSGLPLFFHRLKNNLAMNSHRLEKRYVDCGVEDLLTLFSRYHS